AEGHPGLAALFAEDHSDHGLAPALAFLFPGEGEDQAFRLHDLAIDAAHPIFLAVRSADAGAISAARPEIHLAGRRGVIAGTQPAHHVLRRGPGLEDEI